MKKLFLFFIIFSILPAHYLMAISSGFQKSQVQVHYGTCPKKPSSDFVFKTSKVFDQKDKSLKAMKEFIQKERLKQKHFLKDYRVTFNPIKKSLSYFLECSAPVLKVSALDEKGKITYDIVLSQDGKTHDPSYLVYLSKSGKPLSLPKAVLPSRLLNQENKEELVLLARKASSLKKVNLQEMIYNKKNEMTMLVKGKKKIVSVFLGESFWEKKLDKLDKIMSYMEVKSRAPSQINITDIEKIVIKF